MDPSVLKAFHTAYYHSNVWANAKTKWLGHCILKNPFDLWIYQEIIHERRPNLIIEAGSYNGGSALFFATMLDLIQAPNRAMVISIDTTKPASFWPKHPRIGYWTDSSTNPAIVRHIKHLIKTWPDELDEPEVLVVLDSDHSKDHVLAEMEAYAPFVRPGGYMIVEDSNINGHPVAEDFGPGPWEAIEEFLPKHPEFEIDTSREKFFMTFNPNGYLRRKEK